VNLSYNFEGFSNFRYVHGAQASLFVKDIFISKSNLWHNLSTKEVKNLKDGCVRLYNNGLSTPTKQIIVYKTIHNKTSE
jgi:hypothetical protein